MAAFKDELSEAVVARIGRALALGMPDFDQDALLASVAPRLPSLELKARVLAIAEAVVELLPPFPRAAPILLAALGAPYAPDGEDVYARSPEPDEPGLHGFACWPLTRAVALAGLEHPDVALPLLAQMTRRFSAEFAVRPFLVAHPERTLAYLHSLVPSPDQHLRRWVSEGTRPRLPWGVRLRAFVDDPSPTLGLLERLRDDPSEYVRRSVANHLGDIAKDHPDLMLDVCERWSRDAPLERGRLIRHACRSLFKAGHPRALALHGYSMPPRVQLLALQVDHERLTLGGTQVVRATLRSTSEQQQRLRIDVLVHLQGSRGKTRERVWKGSDRTLPAGGTLELTFRQNIKPVTTRRYYDGPHRVELVVNGQRMGQAGFELAGC